MIGKMMYKFEIMIILDRITFVVSTLFLLTNDFPIYLLEFVPRSELSHVWYRRYFGRTSIVT